MYIVNILSAFANTMSSCVISTTVWDAVKSKGELQPPTLHVHAPSAKLPPLVYVRTTETAV